MDIINHLLQLPARIVYEGLYFELNVFINGTNDLRLCYDMVDCDKKSKHYKDFFVHGCWQNPFYDNGNKSFLYLAENIYDEKSFSGAIGDCKKFLQKHKII